MKCLYFLGGGHGSAAASASDKNMVGHKVCHPSLLAASRTPRKADGDVFFSLFGNPREPIMK